MLYIHVIDELRTGGAQTHLITMLRQVAGRPDVRHRVVTLFGDGELSAEIRSLGISVDILDFRPFLRQRRFLAAVRELRKLFEEHRPDLVEAHLTWSRLLGLLAAWQARVPVRIGFEQGDLYMNDWKFRLANFFLQFCARRVVVCSEALRDWAYETHRIFRSRLLVLHNCVDLDRFNPAGEIANDFHFEANETVFVTIGTLGRGVNKRVDVCIRALASARAAGANAALVICGDGEQRQELQELATVLNLVPYVRFLGTRSDIPAVLRACDAFCHAAPWEPFGIVAIEAMAVGLPVILPDSGGIREVLARGEGGVLYPPLDHEALGLAMAKLANNSRLRKKMGAAGLQVVRQDFCVGRYIERLYKEYEMQMAGDLAETTEVGA